MKLSTQSGILDIPQDAEVEIKSSHPFFSEEGSASIPMSIPATIPNCSLLDWPDRINRSTRFMKKTSGFIECGVYRKSCTIISESAGKDSGIALCLALTESEIYTKMRDKTLPELLINFGHIPTRTTIMSPYELYAHNTHLPVDEFAIFPVASDLDNDGNVTIINEVDDTEIISQPRTVKIGDTDISVPQWYGVAPFIFLKYVIQEAFRAGGFTIEHNCFMSGPLSRIVVVHNRADISIDEDRSWQFCAADMVPDMTMSDFITWLRDKFGAIVTNNNGAISIRLMKDLVALQPDFDFTPLTIDSETIVYPEQKSLSRSMNTSIQSAAPAAESLEDLRQRYSQYATCNEYASITGTGLFFVESLQKFYHRNSAGVIKLVGSSAFTYRRDAGFPVESKDTDDSFLPTIEVNGDYMPYIGERQHIKLDIESGDSSQPLQICYAHDITTDDGVITVGSSFDIRDGINPDLTPEGLTPYWRWYENLLLNGAPEFTIECDIPITDILSIDIATPKFFRGCHCLIKEMTYKITDSIVTRAKISLQVLPVYTDAIQAKSISFNSSLTWGLVSEREIFDGVNGYTVDETDGLTDYDVDRDKPDFIPSKAGFITKVRQRWLKYTYEGPSFKNKKMLEKLGFDFSQKGVHEWQEYFISQGSEE